MADHHVRHFLRVRVRREHIADELAVAEDRHTVGERLDLMHFVRDDNDRLSVVAHVAQYGEELVGLLRRENRGRLVKDENVRAAVENLYDLDRLLLGDGHIVDLLRGVDAETVFVADLADLCRGCFEIELAGQTENDIFRRRQHIHELEMLMDHADAVVKGVLGGADDDFLSVDLDLALIREIDAGEHIHKRRLAAAVFAEQREDLSAVNIQPYLIVG